MIQIKLNGELTVLDGSCSLDEALKLWGYAQGPYAVAVNKKVIQRKHYSETILQQDSVVHVITPMQGG